MPKLSQERIEEIYKEILSIPYSPEDGKIYYGGGRPSKYKDELILDLLTYFNVEPYTSYETKAGVRSKDANDLPTIDGWCYKIGITDQTYQNWRKNNPRFKEAADLVVLSQRNMLMVNSLHNNYNANFAALIGRTQYGWDTKQGDEEPDVNTVYLQAEDAEL